MLIPLPQNILHAFSLFFLFSSPPLSLRLFCASQQQNQPSAKHVAAPSRMLQRAIAINYRFVFPVSPHAARVKKRARSGSRTDVPSCRTRPTRHPRLFTEMDPHPTSNTNSKETRRFAPPCYACVAVLGRFSICSHLQRVVRSWLAIFPGIFPHLLDKPTLFQSSDMVALVCPCKVHLERPFNNSSH